MTNKHIDFVMNIKNITPIERIILLFLINNSNENYIVEFNPNEIAYKCSCSVVKSYTSLNTLVNRGFLEKLQGKQYKIILS